MPNWCSTNFTFEGEKDEIARFHKRLNQIISAESVINNENCWLGNVVVGYGFDCKKIPCRGHIDDVIDDIVIGGDSAYFCLSTTTAWVPLLEMWDFILKGEYPSVSYVYLAIEPGCGIYINTDTSGKHYNEKYLLDLVLPEKVFGKDVDLYNFYSEKADFSKDVKRITGREFDDVEEIISYITEQARKKDALDDCFISIGEFKSDK